MHHNHLIRWMWAICILMLSACQSPGTATPAPPTATVTPAPLRVNFPAAPATLCREATQLRLQPQLTGVRPAEPLNWVINGSNNPLTGTWDPNAALYVAFPAGRPLAPGAYTLALYRDTHIVGEHNFTIVDTPPQITNLTLALTPDGPPLTNLETGTRLFYLRYNYTGACAGAPIWVAVYHENALLCRDTVTVQQERGAEVFACYLDDATPLAEGNYRALITLANEATRGLSFEISQPEPPPLRCNPAFVATGITPAGVPFRPGERFEWYSQSLYAGQSCEGLQPGTPWEARWYRQQTLVHETRSLWTGDANGLVWDALTGEPFLRPGTYTVSLQVGNLAPIILDFRIIAYATPTPAP